MAITHDAMQAVHRSHELGDEAAPGREVDVAGPADLGDLALAHHDDAVAERHRLRLVMGDVDRRHAQSSEQRVDLDAQHVAQLGVERGQRLVEQQHARLGRERAGQGHALLLPARELIDTTMAQLADVAQVYTGEPSLFIHTLSRSASA